MVEICRWIVSPLSRSFIKEELVNLGVVAAWAEIAGNLLGDNRLESKL
jgi:hypothetical protein